MNSYIWLLVLVVLVAAWRWQFVEAFMDFLRERSKLEVDYLTRRLLIIRELQKNLVVSRVTTWGSAWCTLQLLGWGMLLKVIGGPKPGDKSRD
jgi:hypothetical protein